MRSQGNCGRGNRYYGRAEDVLKGRLASEHHERTETPEEEDVEEEPQVKTCEHGVPLWRVAQCHDCAFLYGWEKPR